MSGFITVYGAYGHTGRFVVAELARRGWTPVLAGRDSAKLNDLAAQFPDSPRQPAAADNGSGLDKALAGSLAVINCAGPFAETAGPLIEAAMRANIPYLDVAAEIEANLDTFANYAERARSAGIIVVPAMAFYGGLGDLLATAAARDWRSVDEITIAYGLDSWQPTGGTRASGRVSRQRRNGRRVTFNNGKLEYRDDQAPAGEWVFPEPLGVQQVATEFTMADAVTIPHHLDVRELRSYMTMSAVADLVNPDSPPPAPVDDRGRSAQKFIVEVFARKGEDERRARASGQDIYAVSAPLVVEAVERIIREAPIKPGVYSAGQAFDALDFLRSLEPEHLSFELVTKG
jgi:Saccharopine dehydrogenase NADP binding domain